MLCAFVVARGGRSGAPDFSKVRLFPLRRGLFEEEAGHFVVACLFSKAFDDATSLFQNRRRLRLS
jgi:hypothetical protein